MIWGNLHRHGPTWEGQQQPVITRLCFFFLSHCWVNNGERIPGTWLLRFGDLPKFNFERQEADIFPMLTQFRSRSEREKLESSGSGSGPRNVSHQAADRAFGAPVRTFELRLFFFSGIIPIAWNLCAPECLKECFPVSGDRIHSGVESGPI